jgi:hypothetical protein
VVNGVFAEEFNENHNCQVFRSFSRTFSLVPAVNCWIILSDMMFITLVSSELMEVSKLFLVYFLKVYYKCAFLGIDKKVLCI